MKKLITLTLMMVLGCAMSFAQNKAEFVDKDGKVIANGSTINALGTIEEPFEESFEQQSGIFIKNTTGESISVNLKVTHKKAAEGVRVMTCGTGQCFFLDAGNNAEGTVEIEGNALHDTETHVEYDLGAKGTAEVEMALSINGKAVSTILVKFTAKEVSGIENIAANTLCNIYDITGKLVKANVNKNAVKALNKGMYLVRELSGTKNVNKVVIK